MFIAIENGQFINENQIFQIAFGQSPNGATVLAFTADGENPRRGDVINDKELQLVKAMVKRPGWVKLADGFTYTNLNRCAYIVFAHVPTVGDTARIFIAGRQMHFAKDQGVVKNIRQQLMTLGREPNAKPDSPYRIPAPASAPTDGSPPPHNAAAPAASGQDAEREDTPPPT